MPLWLLLIPYAIIFAIFIIFSLFNFWHLLRFGFFTFRAALFLIFYISTGLGIIFWTLQNLAGIDWIQPLFTLDGFGSGSIGPF